MCHAPLAKTAETVAFYAETVTLRGKGVTFGGETVTFPAPKCRFPDAEASPCGARARVGKGIGSRFHRGG